MKFDSENYSIRKSNLVPEKIHTKQYFTEIKTHAYFIWNRQSLTLNNSDVITCEILHRPFKQLIVVIVLSIFWENYNSPKKK